MMTYKGIVYLYAAWAVGVLVLLGALGYQTQRVKTLKAELAQAQSQIEICVGVNKVSEQTLKQLETEYKTNMTLCEKRIAVKDKTINKIDKIRNLKGGSNDTVSPKGKVEPKSDLEAGTNTNCPDDICSMLDSLFTSDNSADEVH